MITNKKIKYNEQTGEFEYASDEPDMSKKETDSQTKQSQQQKSNTSHTHNILSYTDDPYILQHKETIIRLYVEDQSFAARKIIVDALGCTWAEAETILDNLLENEGFRRNQISSQFRIYYHPTYIDSNKNEIFRLYRNGKTFAARKYFIDVYGCSWEEAGVKLEIFVNQH